MLVEVKNRSKGTSVYTIPELGDKRNIRREFAPHETKKIDLEELKALTFIPGGMKMLKNYLQILDKKVQVELGLRPEPEYNMSEEDIKNLLKNGSLDSFLDCLDFAPPGVIDLIKQYAVQMPLNDSQKREAILSKTGFDVSKALLRLKEANEGDANVTSSQKERRVPIKEENVRRTNIPEYKVVK